MKTKLTVEALALVGMAAGLAVTSGCRTTYSENADLSLQPMPAALDPEPVGNVTYPNAETEKAKPYWQQHPEAVAALDKRPAAPVASSAAAKVGAGYTTYIVKSGESLSKIAVAHGFRTADVLAVNPGLNPNKIRAGQTIVLPGASYAKPASSQTKAAPAKVSAAGGTYVVQKGDILGRIANKHGVKVADLKKANGLASDKIVVGQKLVIPGAKAAQPKTDVKVQPPKVPAQQQKAASKPAAQSASSADQPKPDVKSVPSPDIKPNLPEVPPPAIVPPPPAPVPPPPPPPPAPASASAKGTPYTVQDGEDLLDIAVKWGVSIAALKDLNKLSSDKVESGQVLMIPAPSAD